MPRVLNKPSSWKPQVNVNTKRMKQLMKDVRTDVVARTRNSKDLDQWMQKLAPYTASNCFVTGAHAQPMQEMVNQIAGVVNQTSLPSGSNAEIVKGVMAEACMTMVTNVGEDIKNDLRRIAVDCYNNKLAPRETAKVMGEKIDSFSRARCQAIARTETCRAANLANHINAKEMGAKSYHVICNEGACEYCLAAYGENQDVVYDIDDTENLPPYHTNCRCTPTYSMEEPPLTESSEEPIEETIPQQTPSNDSKEINTSNTQFTTSDGKHTININEVNDPTEFLNNLKNAVKTVDKRLVWRVEVPENASNYNGCKMFVTEHGSTIAIREDGDIISVCAYKENGKSLDNSRALLEFATTKGGTKLDSFDGNYGFYRRCGFEPVSYIEFNEEFAPPGWEKEKDKTEKVIFFKYTGKQSEYVNEKTFYSKFDSIVDEGAYDTVYDNAYAERDKDME